MSLNAKWKFHGGIHLPDHKAESNSTPIQEIALPKKLVLPLQQHIGHAAEPIVEVGDKVLKGEMIARDASYVCAPVHAPSSGIVVAIEPHAIPHSSGLNAPCIVIETDGEDTWGNLPAPIDNCLEATPSVLGMRIRWAGMVGLGGATFPTSVKLNSGSKNQIDTLIINVAECEPYITCDDRVAREHADEVIRGICILMRIITAKECLIGIEDNKPEAIASLEKAVADSGKENIQVCVVPTLYPSGGEKQLIKLLTGREVPSKSLPADVGVVCQNIATTLGVANAVFHGKPLIERVVTVTGQGIKNPGNYRVPLGTPMEELIQAAGGYSDNAKRLIMGGPMMGFALNTDKLPIVKGSNCLLIASEEEAPDSPAAKACIRCGKCHTVCPAQLLPQQLYWFARAKELDKIQEYNLFDCIECGCCSHVCPSDIPLVQYYRYAKTEIWASEREKAKAEVARQRHDFRQARLARLEAERKAKLRKKKEALDKKPKAAATGKKDPKKAAIEAAMKRVAEKKAAQKKAEKAETSTEGGNE